jgi:hypothetical protein
VLGHGHRLGSARARSIITHHNLSPVARVGRQLFFRGADELVPEKGWGVFHHLDGIPLRGNLCWPFVHVHASDSGRALRCFKKRGPKCPQDTLGDDGSAVRGYDRNSAGLCDGGCQDRGGRCTNEQNGQAAKGRQGKVGSVP